MFIISIIHRKKGVQFQSTIFFLFFNRSFFKIINNKKKNIYISLHPAYNYPARFFILHNNWGKRGKIAGEEYPLKGKR